LEELFDNDFFRGLDRLSLVVNRDVRGQLHGERRSVKHGSSVEFADYRDYSPGDDMRYVDWNVYARIEKLLIKLFREEEDLEIFIMVDNSPSMRFGDPSKLVFARRLAAALSYIILSGGDRCALSVFDSGGLKGLSPLRGKRSISEVLRFLRTDHPSSSTTAFNSACAAIAARSRTPGVAIIISDLLFSEDYRVGLRHLISKRHDVYLFHSLEESEINPGLKGDVRIVDSETLETKDVPVGPRLLKLYQSALEDFLTEVERFCRAYSMKYIRLINTTPFKEILFRTLVSCGYLR
jgi:uncharacterized protein (DUF58 family)